MSTRGASLEAALLQNSESSLGNAHAVMAYTGSSVLNRESRDAWTWLARGRSTAWGAGLPAVGAVGGLSTLISTSHGRDVAVLVLVGGAQETRRRADAGEVKFPAA